MPFTLVPLTQYLPVPARETSRVLPGKGLHEYHAAVRGLRVKRRDYETCSAAAAWAMS